MAIYTPKYITFDCHGTLINDQFGAAVQVRYAERIPADQMAAFCRVFTDCRFDEVLGAWQPYFNVLDNAIRRTCKRCGVAYREGDSQFFYDQVPTWGPHPDTTAGLAKIAGKIPLVGLTNAMNEQIPHNMEKLGVPFYAVYTAESAQAYKPRMQAFEYMLDQLGCGPEEVLHVSSSVRYDLMPAHGMGIKNKVFVARGHDVAAPGYGYTEIPDIGGLAAVVGL